MTTRNLAHVETHMLLLGRKNSLERVAAFLPEMHCRSTATSIMHLPMSRCDIADYLGLRLKTVSRMMSALRGRNILKFEGTKARQIVVLDVQALAALADEQLPIS
jgi:CRP/FNR family nitrogen fixation transcriptional regulator